MSGYPEFFLCRTCRTKRMAVNGRVKCCGHEETVEAIKEANKPSRMRGRSFGEIVHILETGMTYEESTRIHFGEALLDDIPNLS